MFDRFQLKNGLRVVAEKIPHVKSISIGVWIATGSRNEMPENNGISHFIEHMLFKGTEKRTAKDIAESIENIGGQLNAFTGKECTCYYAKVLDSHLPIAVDVLSDMLFNSLFEEKEIEKEKGVISEEISMYEDSPEDLVHDILSQKAFDNSTLGLPILGTNSTIHSFSQRKLVDYFKSNYIPSKSVIAVAGNFERENLKELLEESFGTWSDCQKPQEIIAKPSFIKGQIFRTKDIEQVHLCLGMEAIEQGNDDMYSLLVMNNVFGGGMSSRLFQSIREDKGLAYSVFSYPSAYRDTGIFTIYAGMNPNQLDQVLNLIDNEIRLLKDKGLSIDEINKSKEQLKGNYILGLESTSSRMTSIGKSELLLNRVYTQKDILDKINQVTKENVERLIDKIFSASPISIAIVGNRNEYNELDKYFLTVN